MHRLRRSNLASRLLLALGVAGAAFAIATAVQAAIPSAGGLIHACYQFSPPNTGKGVLRVIDAENRETCRVNERPLSWNQTGPTGTRGPTGPTGPAGTAGPTSLRTASTNFVPHEEDDLIIHRVTAEEAGLTILTNPCLVTDYDGTAGGTTNIVCRLTVNGVGPEQEVSVSDNGNPTLGHGDTASGTNLLRVTLVEGDEIKVSVFTYFPGDINEAGAKVQLLMERVGS